MASRGNDIKPGYILEHNNSLYLVIKITHTQPGKGGAYIQAEMKNLKTNAKHYERFRSDGYIKRVILDEREYQYIFEKDDLITVMDLETYEQITINKDILGDKKVYLKDNEKITLLKHFDDIISAKVQDYVVLEVIDTETVIKGQTVSSSYKPALLENNIKITVPPFIKKGDKVVVYTLDNTYYERAKEE